MVASTVDEVAGDEVAGDEATDVSGLISYHNALQDTAQHYNRVNWILHGIFFALNGLYVRSVAVRILPNEINGTEITNVILGVFSGIVGFIFVYVWSAIFKRHNRIIMLMYRQLYTVEDRISAEWGNHQYDFHVHKLIKFDKDKGISNHKIRRTKSTINLIQWIFVFVYMAVLFWYLWLIYLVYERYGWVAYFGIV